MNIEYKTVNTLKYLIRYPEGYTDGAKYPVIIFMHGAGSRGCNIESLKSNPYFRNTERLESFPFITVAPLCSENTWFDLLHELKALLRLVALESYTDAERIYLMGASMGGYATWQLAASMPEYIAAIVPICGGGMYCNAARLANIPVWAHHGALDTTVRVEESEKMVDAVNKAGGNARLTVYPNVAHNAWIPTYTNPEVFEWLLSKTRTSVSTVGNQYDSTEKFG